MFFFVIIIGINVVQMVVVNATTSKEGKHIINSPKYMFLNVRFSIINYVQYINLLLAVKKCVVATATYTSFEYGFCILLTINVDSFYWNA